MSAAMVHPERIPLEILAAAPIAPEQLPALLGDVFGVEPEAVTPLEGPARSTDVHFELARLPGAFPTRLGVFVDVGLTHGPKTDLQLARALAERTGLPALCGLPADHPGADDPYAWLRVAPGRDPERVDERPGDGEGVELVELRGP